MKLHLLRHAKTHQKSPTGKDFDRELLPRGIAQSEALADYLQDKISGIDVWCSDATRTRQTLGILAKTISLGHTSYFKALYLCSYRQYLSMLNHRRGGSELLIVGHNFGISDIANYFTGESSELRTGGYVCIEFDGLAWAEVSRDTGTIVDRYRPSVR